MDLNNIVDDKQMAELEARLKETKDKLEKLVRQYPLATLAIAVGAGFLIARLLEKGRK